MSTPTPTQISKKQIDAMKVIGDAYVLEIIGQLSRKSMRFNELQRAIEDICPTTLADRLKKLEHEKIVSRKEETLDKVSVVYSLTEKGQGILPVIRAIGKFADQFIK